MSYRVWQTGRGDEFGVRMLRDIWQFVSTAKHLLMLDASSLGHSLEKAQWKVSLLWTSRQAFPALAGDFGMAGAALNLTTTAD